MTDRSSRNGAGNQPPPTSEKEKKMTNLVEAWLRGNFPHRRAQSAEIANDLRSHIPIPVDVEDKQFLGNLMERAIGLALCDQAPYLDLFRLLSDYRAARLLRSAGYQDGRRQHTAAPTAAEVFLPAYRLAQLIEFTNPRWSSRPDPEVVARIFRRYPGDLPRHGGETRFEHQAFARLWASYTAGFHTAIRSYGTVTAEVALLGGRKITDLIAGTTVVEIKSGRLDQDDYLIKPIDQLITYALLARLDGHPITHVALYAIRYQRLLRFPIGPFLARLAGHPVDIPRAGSELASLLQDQSYPKAA